MFIITKDGKIISGKSPSLTGIEVSFCVLTKEDDYNEFHEVLKNDIFTRIISQVEKPLIHEILQDVLQKYQNRFQSNRA